jgi:predicted nucleic acid-binding protein
VIVLDANVLTAHLDDTNALHQRATTLLAETGNHELRVSVLTLGEVLVGPVRADDVEAAEEALRTLGVSVVDLPAESARTLAEIRARTGLKMPDACVLLAAEEHQAEVGTFDDKLAARVRDRGRPVRDGVGE